jgi:8-oxo-dGTP pyrophosphatase MutT (NUDIX family)
MNNGRDVQTYDGYPISPDPPHGAMVVVTSRSPEGARYLVLHRAHSGPSFEGPWAWTPPAGARWPGEDVAACATRELEEETGLHAQPEPVQVENTSWALFRLEVPWVTEIRLEAGGEHDRFAWVTHDEACRLCLPAVVGDAIRHVAP